MKRKPVSRPKVLVIEDDPGHQRIFEIYFKQAGAECDCCFDGRAGLQKAFDNHYDLIVIDIHIPELDGFAVATKLRDAHDDTPLIAVTSLTIEGLKKNALKVGFNEFIQKPLSEQETARILEQYTDFKSAAQSPE